ncbi:hypothetical protein GCM10025771_06790 [Niveibacterium umoris]|uniref:ABC-type amino acid transport substrate-binding protein n=1 Tax=Niveibacterium umoris TaxID=1193620 RepID=A0A840BKJ2_9RHOO|nr:ABC transporter substrate-binding protein [Niveibacterium umoris]MBB4013775.1 ABC-type amino acid transport substrate-binding protein [Niveibacterium umoris]
MLQQFRGAMPKALALAAMVLCCPATDAAPTAPLVIDVEDAAAPWSQADGSGAANEIVQTAFAHAGRKILLRVVPYARCKAELLAGSVVGCVAVGGDEAMGRQVRLPKTPLYRVTTVLVSFRKVDSCDAAAWQGATIGRVNGYEYAPRFEQLVRQPHIDVSVALSETLALRMLAAGRMDAVALQLDPLKTLDFVVRDAGLASPPRVACELGPLDSHIGFSLQHPDGARALADFERGHAAAMADGSVARILSRWRERLLEQTAPEKNDKPR